VETSCATLGIHCITEKDLCTSAFDITLNRWIRNTDSEKEGQW